MKEKIVFYGKKVIVFFIALLSLLTLCFTFIKKNETNINGTITEQVNGFAFLPFDKMSVVGEVGALYSSVFFNIFIISICLIVLSIVNFFVKANKLDNTIIVLSLLIGINYMVLGITQVKFMLLASKDIATHTYYYVSTASFVPLIIQTVLTIIYFLLVLLGGNVIKQKSNVVFRGNDVSMSYIDDLKQLKELFDTEVINQEEFDAKKKEILGL